MIIGLLPRPKTNNIFKENLKEANRRLVDISRQHNSCTFVPVHKLFLDHQDCHDHQVAPGLHVRDQIHLNRRGGTILGEHIFKRLMHL